MKFPGFGLKYMFNTRDKAKVAYQEKPLNPGLCTGGMDFKTTCSSPGNVWKKEELSSSANYVTLLAQKPAVCQ